MEGIRKMSVKSAVFSSIGQKVLVATTGLTMFLFFLIPHMSGNILFLFGPDLFNSYAEHLHNLVPILVAVEILMIISISVHMITGFRVAFANAKAHGTRITQKPSEERSLAARLMPYSGGMIFIFIVKHLLDFTLRTKPETMLHGEVVHDVYGMMIDKFSQPGNVIFYVLFMVALALHLSHALQSSLQTYGIFVPREGSKIKLASALIAVAMASTFAIMPVVAYFRTF